MEKLKRVCAWCGKDLDGNGDVGASKANITHGICSQCAINITNFEPRTTNKILNYIREPVFIVDANINIKAANESGQRLIGENSISRLEEILAGDALECAHASEEGGCGKTVHCKTCAIRNILLDTIKSGQGYQQVPAFQMTNTATGIKVQKFILTTEKLNDKILLRIDQVTDLSG